jgi:two-component system, NarL family, response regulator DegU
MTVLGIASNGKEAYDFVAANPPDVILMDVRMPVMDGVEAVKHIKASFPLVKIIMLSTYDEDEFVRNAILAGASGYLLKDISPTELIISIRALNSGVMQISPSLAQKLIQNIYIEDKLTESIESPKDLKWLKTLTKREREIFALIATGHDNNEIADSLNLAVQTVRNQVSTIYSKLNVKDRFEIIKLANKTRQQDNIYFTEPTIPSTK